MIMKGDKGQDLIHLTRNGPLSQYIDLVIEFSGILSGFDDYVSTYISVTVITRRADTSTRHGSRRRD